ncbi:similar to Saccharomyces cerevisiae YGL010W Putative protein of unknown function [Maudiozyma saulgeensis]|uniref:Uncharacterized protein n=1 Tax=Maudiozyma saulgeensis TaxID=1789683 RepID=A0A1X7RA27_9SACH|nr:similar to Saccharomyces cerevisiae YGL010W Putative protein of unknown function [Kazachstania saulgeensis]
MKHSLLDLRSQLRFYKSYHHNVMNVAIHSVFVPTILVTSASLLHRFTLYGSITLTHVLTVCYAVFYCLLCLPVGILASGLLVLLTVALDKKWLYTSQTQDICLFVMSWVFQFIGHGVFEHRKPALLDNLVQSLVLAPYFILFELLFKLGLYEDLNQQLIQDIATTKKSN